MTVPFSESDKCWCHPFNGPAHPSCPMHGHSKDEDCTVGADGLCVGCGVDHSEECAECGGRGFHKAVCEVLEAAERRATAEAERQEGVEGGKDKASVSGEEKPMQASATLNDIPDKVLADMIRQGCYTRNTSLLNNTKLLVLAVPYDDGEADSLEAAFECFRELLTADDWEERNLQVLTLKDGQPHVRETAMENLRETDS